MRVEAVYTAVGHRIRAAREARGLRQSDLATLVSLTRSSITNIEQGQQRLLLHTLFAIAQALGVAPQSLLPETTDEKRVDDFARELAEQLTVSEQEWIRSGIAPTSIEEGTGARSEEVDQPPRPPTAR